MHSAKFILTVFLLFFAAQLLGQPLQLEAATFTVDLAENRLSLTAEKMPLRAILLELISQGITVKIDPQINPLITANFKNRPVEQALESILKPASFSLLWEAQTTKAAEQTIHLAEIQVFQSGRKDRMQTLGPRKTSKIVKNKKGILYVKDEILLYLRPDTDLRELSRLVQSYQATLLESSALPGLVKILLPANSDVFAISREIKNKLNLDLSQPNYAYPLQYPVNISDSTVRAGLETSYYAPTDNNAPIAILDSGLAADGELSKFVLSSLDVLSPKTPISDTLGHGTQMAFIATGIVKPYGAASDDDSYIPIIAIKAFDDNGYTTDFTIMDSINFALENNARVMSLSWGTETKSDFMEKAFEYARAKGLVIVASAGNEPTGNPVYPAAYPSVIGVGALGPHGQAWEKSNYGDFVSIYAPGFATLPVGHKGEPGLYAGTSISAAHVANAIAGYLSENPAATLEELNAFLNKKY